MDFSIFKTFQIFGIVSNWATKALADGKVTLNEAADLAIKIAELLDVTIEIEVPDKTEVELDDDEDLFRSLPVVDERTQKPTGKPRED
jgi:hypothetical protein